MLVSMSVGWYLGYRECEFYRCSSVQYTVDGWKFSIPMICVCRVEEETRKDSVMKAYGPMEEVVYIQGHHQLAPVHQVAVTSIER